MGKNGRYYEKRAKRNLAFYERRKHRRVKIYGQEAPRITIKIIMEEKTND